MRFEYVAGYWEVVCPACGASYLTDSIADAYKRSRTHERTCTGTK